MRNELILEERIMAVKEHLCGFILEQVLDEFYYDGESYIDNGQSTDLAW